MSTAETPKPSLPGADNAVPLYEKVFTPTMLRWLAIMSFVLVVGTLLFWAFEPSRLNNSMARFVASLLVAVLMAVFFFVFYPDQLEMSLPGVMGATVRLTGPLVLLVVVFWLVHTYMPAPVRGELFEVWKNGERGGIRLTTSAATKLKGREGDPPPPFMLVGFPDGQRELYGIYVLFPDDVSTVKVWLYHEGWEAEFPYVLERDGNHRIDVSSMKDSSNTP